MKGIIIQNTHALQKAINRPDEGHYYPKHSCSSCSSGHYISKTRGGLLGHEERKCGHFSFGVESLHRVSPCVCIPMSDNGKKNWTNPDADDGSEFDFSFNIGPYWMPSSNIRYQSLILDDGQEH